MVPNESWLKRRTSFRGGPFYGDWIWLYPSFIPFSFHRITLLEMNEQRSAIENELGHPREKQLHWKKKTKQKEIFGYWNQNNVSIGAVFGYTCFPDIHNKVTFPYEYPSFGAIHPTSPIPISPPPSPFCWKSSSLIPLHHRHPLLHRNSSIVTNETFRLTLPYFA